MLDDAHIARIDADWLKLHPSPDRNKGERRMLYELIKPEETLAKILSGKFAPELQQASLKIGTRLDFREGIIVATSKRVLMVDKGLFSTEAAEIAYENIEAITHSTGMFRGGLRITGKGTMAFRIEMVNPKNSVVGFAAYVGSRVTA